MHRWPAAVWQRGPGLGGALLYSVLSKQPITIYGDGYQVRDVLHVHDLLDAMAAVREHDRHHARSDLQLGGGMERAVSVVEMLEMIERETGKPLHLDYSEVRPGDQPLYISDTAKLRQHTGWVRSGDSLTRSLRTIRDILGRATATRSPAIRDFRLMSMRSSKPRRSHEICT